MCVLYMYVFLNMCLCVCIFICVCGFFYIVCCFTADVFVLCVLMGECVYDISKHHHHTHQGHTHHPPHTSSLHHPSHIHLNTVTPDYTHTCTYRIMLHPHTGANEGDLQRGDQKDPYLVLKTLKFLLREWANSLNARSSD